MPSFRHLVLPMLALIFAGACALPHRGPRDAPPPELAPLAGVWENPDTGDRHTLRWDRGRYHVTMVESSSGERYVVANQQWNGESLRWSYHIPTTNYAMTLRTRGATPEMLACDWWDSDGNTRAEVLRRVKRR